MSALGHPRQGALRRQRRFATLRVQRLEERVVPTLLGNQLFPSDNPWNQRIANAPVAANSAAIISAITAAYGDGMLHPDFGQDFQDSQQLYGIPYNVVHGNTTPPVNVVLGTYADESDPLPAPIPKNAVLEGDLQNGPTVGLANRGDSHLLVYDEANNVAYEFFRASRPTENSDGQWHAAQETVWNFNTNEFRTLGWTSADAAGLSILAGLARPDEGLPIAEGGQDIINHALRMTLKNAVILNQFLYPASHTADPGNTNAATEPPMGTRFRLKASVDISSLDPESRVIAQALKDYGLIVADNGSNFFLTGASYAVDADNGFALTWNDSDIQDAVHGLKSLHFSDFEVVDLTPVVTGLSTSRGPAGTTLTVTGHNFSGAAGHLQMLFGSTLAMSVTVVDDGHVTAVVPAGSGTVDVLVQSGASDPNDSSDYTSPVFGYGTSAVTKADRFTYASLQDVGDTIADALDTGLSSGGTYSNTAAIGDGPNGSLDVDMYQFQGTAGSALTAQTWLPPGGTAMDTYLRLFDASGNELASNNDNAGGGTLYSLLNYTFHTTATYDIGVSGYANSGYDPNTAGRGDGGSTGDYRLDLAVTPDISLQSVRANGGTILTVTYQISGGPLVLPIQINFYSSSNTVFNAGDTLLSSISLRDPTDLTSGPHTKTYTIGGAAGQVALPGAGLADTATDYYLLAVANPTGAIVEFDGGPPDPDNTQVFMGNYHAAGGPVMVQGTDGADTVTVTAAGTDLVLGLNGVNTSYAAGDVFGFAIRVHGGDDDVSAAGTATPVSVWGGDGNDTFTAELGTGIFDGGAGTNILIGPNAANVWNITATNGGKVRSLSFSAVECLIGGTGTDTFKFSGTAPSLSGTISGGSAGADKLDYSLYTGGAIAVNLATLSASRVNGGAAGGFSHIVALTGSRSSSDKLTGPNTTNAWTITGANAGKIGTFAFTATEYLVGGTGVDVFKFTTAGRTVNINGRGGADWLDYSAFPSTAAVTVDLTTGSATNVQGGAAGSVSNVANVRGGAGNDTLVGGGGNILVGGGGNDMLTDLDAGSAASDRSLLIGGAGSDSLTTGAAGDLLIGSTTSYDVKNAALQSILAEWQSADDYNTRFNRLEGKQSGGLNGTNKLIWATTVKDDATPDTLVGGAGWDWFFANYPGNDMVISRNVPGHEHLDNSQ